MPNNYLSLSSGLVGYWSFDGSKTNWATGQTADSSGKGNNGSLINMSTSTSPVTGKIGQALQFSGSSNYVDAGTSASLQPSSFSISAWIYPMSNTGDSYQCVAGDNFWGDWYGYGLCVNSSLQLFGRVMSASAGSNTPNYQLALNTWYYSTLTYTSSAITLYVNGVQVGQTSSPVTLAYEAGNSLRIDTVGGSPPSTDYFKGKIDEVRIYNRALSANEVQQLYNLGAANVAHSNSGSNAPLSSGLVGYWPFDGSQTNWATGKTSDLSGSGNTGSLTNMSTTTSPVVGKIGQALSFNGSTNYISIADADSFTPANTGFTICAWINPSAYPSSHAAIIGKGTASNYEYSLYFESTGQAQIIFWQSNGANYSNALGGTVPLNAWSFECGTLDSSMTVTAVYVNTVLGQQQYTTAGTITNGPSPVNIGRRPDNAAGQYFTGKIDDVRVYNRALSVNEMKQLYNLGNANAGHSNSGTNAPLSSGLTGYWPFDGSQINWTTGTAQDISGNLNNGRMISMSTTTSPVAGKVGQALKFDGSTSYVNLGGMNNYCTASTCTMVAWVKPAAASGGSVSNAYNGSGIIADAGGWISLVQANITGVDKLWAYNYDTAEEHVGTSYTIGQWIQLVLVHTGGQLYLYANGAPVGNVASGNTGTITNALQIGKGYNTATYPYFNGTIDDVRVYNRALSAQEVAQLYAATK